jgi:hypothetical protein
MATVAAPARSIGGDDRFFLISAIVMAAVLCAGFSVQFAAGRSSFGAPLLVHVHAVVFFGWVAIYVAQNALAATGSIALHRRLGWIAAGWVVAMVVLGTTITVVNIRRGVAPFIFQPQHFLIFNPLSVIFFAGLTAAAITMRRRTDWHRRLHFCGMALLLGPGFGRLLPMPLLIPWGFQATFVALMLFPLAGIVADLRRDGRVHPAWWSGVGAMLLFFALSEVLPRSAIGSALYAWVTAGSPGAAVPGLAFPPPPPIA